MPIEPAFPAIHVARGQDDPAGAPLRHQPFGCPLGVAAGARILRSIQDGIAPVSAGRRCEQAGSSVTHNTAASGGGIYNHGGGTVELGTVTLDPSSSVTGNHEDNCEPDIGSCT